MGRNQPTCIRGYNLFTKCMGSTSWHRRAVSKNPKTTKDEVMNVQRRFPQFEAAKFLQLQG